jgi:GNAT superfamily N-acetyltransferase
MSGKYIVELLDIEKHDDAAFSSGVAPLDDYLKTQAARAAKRRIAVTYVLCEQDSTSIIGYYTLGSASIETTYLPEDLTKRLPRYNAFPAILISRLAIDQQYRGQGFGALLLVNALKRCLKLSKEVATMAILIDAKDETAARFPEKYGFRRLPDRPDTLYIPMAEIQGLRSELSALLPG